MVSAKLRYKMLSAQKGEISSHWACLKRLLRGAEILAESGKMCGLWGRVRKVVRFSLVSSEVDRRTQADQGSWNAGCGMGWTVEAGRNMHP